MFGSGQAKSSEKRVGDKDSFKVIKIVSKKRKRARNEGNEDEIKIVSERNVQESEYLMRMTMKKQIVEMQSKLEEKEKEARRWEKGYLELLRNTSERNVRYLELLRNTLERNVNESEKGLKLEIAEMQFKYQVKEKEAIFLEREYWELLTVTGEIRIAEALKERNFQLRIVEMQSKLEEKEEEARFLKKELGEERRKMRDLQDKVNQLRGESETASMDPGEILTNDLADNIEGSSEIVDETQAGDCDKIAYDMKNKSETVAMESGEILTNDLADDFEAGDCDQTVQRQDQSTRKANSSYHDLSLHIVHFNN
jgi:hypothetical protein